MNQITIEQLEELINLRLGKLDLENYQGNIEDINDNILKWLLTIRARKLNK